MQIPKELKEEQKNCKHKYFLKCKSFSKQQYYRECSECKKVAKVTKYKMNE